MFGYTGRPVEMLDEQPLSMRGSMADEPERSSEEILPDLKIGQLFKHHLKDWLVIVLLFIIAVILNVIHPFNRFVGKYNIDSVRFPHKKNTVPIWSVPVRIVYLLKFSSVLSVDQDLSVRSISPCCCRLLHPFSYSLQIVKRITITQDSVVKLFASVS